MLRKVLQLGKKKSSLKYCIYAFRIGRGLPGIWCREEGEILGICGKKKTSNLYT